MVTERIWGDNQNKFSSVSYKSRKQVGESNPHSRARQLYKNISILFLFSVKYGKLSTGVNAQRLTVSLR